MGFLDRLLGREPAATQSPAQPQTQPAATDAAAPRAKSADEIAVERYRYLLRTAPPESIEEVHREAFSKLTPKQRDIMFEQLTADAPAGDAPADNSADALARSATRSELRQPGLLERSFGRVGAGGASGVGGGAAAGAGAGAGGIGFGFGGIFASSLLGSVAGYVIGSSIAQAFIPDSVGTESAAGDSSSDSSTDNSSGDNAADASGSDGYTSGADTAGDNASGGDYASGGDTGTDFGTDLGTDFGGDFGF